MFIVTRVKVLMFGVCSISFISMGKSNTNSLCATRTTKQ